MRGRVGIGTRVSDSQRMRVTEEGQEGVQQFSEIAKWALAQLSVFELMGQFDRKLRLKRTANCVETKQFNGHVVVAVK